VSLVKDRNFLRFWWAQGCSLLGSQVTVIVLPLLAIQSFNASSFEVGILTAASYLPYLLFGLAAGVWVDRIDLKKVLVTCDLARFFLLAIVPILYSFHFLNLPGLCLIAFLLGLLTLVFDVGAHSFLPQITSSEKEIIEGNTKLYLTFSISQMLGPGIGGALVQAVSAPLAIIADCLSYLFSGILLLGVRIKRSESEFAHTRSIDSAGMVEEVKTGLKFVVRNDYLKPLVICMAVSNFFDLYGIIQAVLVVFVMRELGMSPWEFGTVLAMSNLGAMVGTLVNGRWVKRFGIGNVIVISSFVPGAALLFLPFASVEQGMLSVALPLLVANFGVSVFNVNQLSLRQQITPVNLLGRMNATIRFLIWGTIPLGAFIGGVLGESIGLRPTLMIAALGSLCAGLPIVLSKIRTLEAIPMKEIEGSSSL
jgi:MFS family permease